PGDHMEPMSFPNRGSSDDRPDAAMGGGGRELACMGGSGWVSGAGFRGRDFREGVAADLDASARSPSMKKRPLGNGCHRFALRPKDRKSTRLNSSHVKKSYA